MLKIKLSNFSFMAKTTNTDGNMVADSGGGISIVDGSSEKIENLSKAKIIQKLAKYKKLDFTKTKKLDSISNTLVTAFFTIKARLAFT